MKKGEKKLKPVSETANEVLDNHVGLSILKQYPNVKDAMIEFAKLKVTEALHETSEHFKNPENVSYIKNHYSLDKIV